MPAEKKNYSLLQAVFFYLVLLALWQGVFYLGVEVLGIWKPYAFPSPLGVFASFGNLLSRGLLFVGLQASLWRLVVGFSMALALGLILGLIIARIAFLDANLRPLLLGLQTLPSVCWVPFAILWFGLGSASIIFIQVVGSTFAMSLAVVAGIRNIDPLYIKVAQAYNAKGWKLVYRVIFPAALPDLITGMKQAWSFAWRGLMAGEMLVGNSGLGQILMMGRELADINQVAAMMIVILLVGVLVEILIFGRLERQIRERWGYTP